MQSEQYPDVPEDFGHWLAGFIAGEGSFGIYPRPGRPGYYVECVISLRADDGPALEQIRHITGLGGVSHRDRANGGNALAVWRVHRRADLVRLVALLDQFPLRAKKANDYVLWRQAVLYIAASIRPGGGRRNNWEPVRVLAEALVTGRKYESDLVASPVLTPPAQLWD